MRLFLLLFPLMIAIGPAAAQESEDTDMVASVIHEMFDAMRAGDSSRLRPLFHKEAQLHTVYTDRDGHHQVRGGTMDRFMQSVGTPHEEVYDERIWTMDILLDGNLASVWTDYTFFLGETMSHCGVNAFQMVRTDEGWKILQITDTRRKQDCQTEADDREKALHTLMDQWHEAAANADEDTFFGLMSREAIYLGTDPSERWLRDELKTWSAEYFERETAWAFTPSNRKVYFTSDGNTAWFEETLDTWMGICRGSGVLQRQDGQWKIVHYNLALNLPNDKIEGFRALWGKG